MVLLAEHLAQAFIGIDEGRLAVLANARRDIILFSAIGARFRSKAKVALLLFTLRFDDTLTAATKVFDNVAIVVRESPEYIGKIAHRAMHLHGYRFTVGFRLADLGEIQVITIGSIVDDKTIFLPSAIRNPRPIIC